MPDTPSSDPPTGESPEPPRAPVRWGAVIGGAVLGFVATWLLFALVVLGMYSTFGDSATTQQNVIGLAALLALPVITLVLMLSPQTRHAGAGLLMGIAIGSVVGAGICGTVIGFGG